MSDLQISLLIAAVVIIIAILAYNRYVDYRAKKKIEQAFSDPVDDVLMAKKARSEPVFGTAPQSEPRQASFDVPAERRMPAQSPEPAGPVEPTFEPVPVQEAFPEPEPAPEPVVPDMSFTPPVSESAPAPAAKPAPAASGTRVEPVFEPINAPAAAEPEEQVQMSLTERAPATDDLPQESPAEKEQAPAAQTIPREPKIPEDGPDKVFESLAVMRGDQPKSFQRIQPAIDAFRNVGDKAIRYFARDAEDGSIAVPVPGRSYTEVWACFQKVSRSGPVSDTEYAQFQIRLGEVAREIGFVPEFADERVEIATAAQLYEIVLGFDVRLGLSLVSNERGWTRETVETVLKSNGFTARADGLYEMLDPNDSQQLFTVSLNEDPVSQSVSRLSLMLNVPCIAEEKGAFSVLCRYARALCMRLNASIVDDGNQVLDESYLASIANEVVNFYAGMRQAGLPAGSRMTQRLFG